MISIWTAFLMMVFTTIVIFAALYSGFYFAGKKESREPKSPGLFERIRDLIEDLPIKKKDEKEEEGIDW